LIDAERLGDREDAHCKRDRGDGETEETRMPSRPIERILHATASMIDGSGDAARRFDRILNRRP
jgi:hypothetical protein